MNTWLLNATSCQTALTAWAVVIPFLPYREIHSVSTGQPVTVEPLGNTWRPRLKHLVSSSLLAPAVAFDARCNARRL